MSQATPVYRCSAPAKVTLSLRVTGVRADGMHQVDAEMVTVDLVDDLEIVDGQHGVTVAGGAEDIPAGKDNLVQRALDLAGRSAAVAITKRIPSQAGLGGGSADAAAVLRWAGFTDVEAAASIGADVAFCLVGGRARVTGIGEVVEPLAYKLQTLTLLTPPLGCPTPAVYRVWDEMGGPVGDHGNDLEPAALKLVPELADWRDRLAEASGRQPRLAGSGSTWFVEGAYPGEGRVVCRTLPAERVG